MFTPNVARSRTRHLAIAVLIAGTTIAVMPGYVAAEPATASLERFVPRDGLAELAVDALARLRAYAVTGSHVQLHEYEDARTTVAGEVGLRLSIDGRRLERAWNQADVPHQLAVMAALSQLGTPYAKNTSKPGIGFDCSGLTTYAWSVAGAELPRQSGAQIRTTAPRTQETAMAGDLVHYPGHIMMYLGVDRAIVHAIKPGRPVEVDQFAERRQVTFGAPV